MRGCRKNGHSTSGRTAEAGSAQICQDGRDRRSRTRRGAAQMSKWKQLSHERPRQDGRSKTVTAKAATARGAAAGSAAGRDTMVGGAATEGESAAGGATAGVTLEGGVVTGAAAAEVAATVVDC